MNPSLASAIAAVLLIVAEPAASARLGPFDLVADLEDDRPVRPAFGGWAWSLRGGLVVVGGDGLWRVDPDGLAPPVLLLRAVDAGQAQQLEGELVTWGLDAAGEEGLWLTDGGVPRRLAPASLRSIVSNGVARSGGVFLAKTYDSYVTSSLWRLSETAAPVRLGPGGIMFDLFTSECNGVWTTPTGFLYCGDIEGTRGLWFTDGSTAGQHYAFPWSILDDLQPGLSLGGRLHLSVEYGSGLLVTDGTPAGTELLADGLAGPPFDLWGEIGWVGCDAIGCRVWAGGSGIPKVERELPSFMEIAAPGPIGGILYFRQRIGPYPNTETALWALDRVATTSIGTIPGASGNVVGNASGSEALMLVNTPQIGGIETWTIDAAGLELERVTTPSWAYPPRSPTIQPLENGDPPLVPWVDAEGFARPGRVEAGAEVVPFEGLILPGTASSRVTPIGASGGSLLLTAFTAVEGASVWRSDGTAAGTVPLLPSACDPTFPARPQLVGEDLVVDCQRPDGRATAWLLGSGGPVPLELEVAIPGQLFVQSSAPPVVRLPSALVYPGYHEGQWGLISRNLSTGATTALGPVGCQGLARTGSRAVVSCYPELWSTDGTVAGTTVLPVPAAGPIEAGGKAVLLGDPAWLSDGTAIGTTALAEPVWGVAPASPSASSTCAWNYQGLFRLDLGTGALDLLAAAPPALTNWFPLPRTGDGVVVLLGQDDEGRRHWWRCDGTAGGTREIFVDKPSGAIAESLVSNDSFVWRHSRGLRERVERLSLANGLWTLLLDRDRGVEEHPSRYGYPQIEPLGLTEDALWIALPEATIGRELWILPLGPLFADGFESGDLTAWSTGGTD